MQPTTRKKFSYRNRQQRRRVYSLRNQIVRIFPSEKIYRKRLCDKWKRQMADGKVIISENRKNVACRISTLIRNFRHQIAAVSTTYHFLIMFNKKFILQTYKKHRKLQLLFTTGEIIVMSEWTDVEKICWKWRCRYIYVIVSRILVARHNRVIPRK